MWIACAGGGVGVCASADDDAKAPANAPKPMPVSQSRREKSLLVTNYRQNHRTDIHSFVLIFDGHQAGVLAIEMFLTVFFPIGGATTLFLLTWGFSLHRKTILTGYTNHFSDAKICQSGRRFVSSVSCSVFDYETMPSWPRSFEKVAIASLVRRLSELSSASSVFGRSFMACIGPRIQRTKEFQGSSRSPLATNTTFPGWDWIAVIATPPLKKLHSPASRPPRLV